MADELQRPVHRDDLTTVVLHYGALELTQRCVESIPGRVFVVDNQGDYPNPDVRPERNLGFAAGCNLAANMTAGDLIFFNNDAWGDPTPLGELLTDEIGIVGCRIVDQHGNLQHAGTRLFYDGHGVLTAQNVTAEQPSRCLDVVTGAAMAVSRECVEAVGGFDTGFWNGYEDVDFCLRARKAGFKVWYEAGITVTHLGAQAGPERWRKVRENVARLNEKWAKA